MDPSPTKKHASDTAAALPEELVEEVLLRFPPDDPASLVRAAAFSKRWCRLVCGRGFRRRFREFHVAPPLLAFVCLRDRTAQDRLFVPTSSFKPRHHGDPGYRYMEAVHSSHGRVLLRSAPRGNPEDLFVWDPTVDELRKLPNGQCIRPTRVIRGTRPCSAPARWLTTAATISTATVRRAVYFKCRLPSTDEPAILKYDLLTRESSSIRIPLDGVLQKHFNLQATLMVMEGRLAFAFSQFTFQMPTLHLWSRDEDARWAQSRVIDLGELLQTEIRWTNVVGFADTGAGGVIFIWSCKDDRLFSLNLKYGSTKVVQESFGVSRAVPYMSFCTPVLVAVSIRERQGR